MMKATWMMMMAGMERAHTDRTMHTFQSLPKCEEMVLLAAAPAHILQALCVCITSALLESKIINSDILLVHILVSRKWYDEQSIFLQ